MTTETPQTWSGEPLPSIDEAMSYYAMRLRDEGERMVATLRKDPSEFRHGQPSRVRRVRMHAQDVIEDAQKLLDAIKTLVPDINEGLPRLCAHADDGTGAHWQPGENCDRSPR